MTASSISSDSRHNANNSSSQFISRQSINGAIVTRGSNYNNIPTQGFANIFEPQDGRHRMAMDSHFHPPALVTMSDPRSTAPNSSTSLSPSVSSATPLVGVTTPIFAKGVSGLPSPYAAANVTPLAIATMSTTNVTNISFIDDGASEASDIDPNLYHHSPRLISKADASLPHEPRMERNLVSQLPSVPPMEEEPTIYYSLHV